MLAPDGVVFGSTVLSSGVQHTPWSRWMMEQLNRDGTFCNSGDGLGCLKAQLDQRFDGAPDEVVGAVEHLRCLHLTPAGQPAQRLSAD